MEGEQPQLGRLINHGSINHLQTGMILQVGARFHLGILMHCFHDHFRISSQLLGRQGNFDGFNEEMNELYIPKTYELLCIYM